MGDQMYFWLGRYQGSALLARFSALRQRAAYVEALLLRYDAAIILAIRFLYGLRIVGPILIGMSRVAAWRFLLFNACGALIWAILVAGAGYWFGHVVMSVLRQTERFQLLALGIVLAAAAGALLLRWVVKRHPRK
jgi:membrane protein DedA with SNARE-associated domain